MKKIFFILSMAFFINANAQNVAKKLQSSPWYVTGNIFNSEKAVLSIAQTPVSDSQVSFSTDGKLNFASATQAGLTMVCPYEVKKDMIKIHYTANTPSAPTKKEVKNFYYKVKESASKNLELTPVSAADFK